MKKFILKLCLICFIFLGLNFGYYILIKKFDWNFSKTYEAANFKNKDYDCIVLGNSLAMDGIDTKYLSKKGFNSYNMALGGANLKTNFVQLNDFLKNNMPPKVVIVGLSSCRGSNLSDESIHPIVETNYGLSKEWNYNNLPMIKFKWIAKEIIKKIISKEYRSAIIVRGQLKASWSTEDKSFKNKINIDNNFNLKQYASSVYLDSIHKLGSKNDFKIILVELPGRKKYQNNVPLVSKPFITLSGRKNKIYNLNNSNFCSQMFDSKKDWLGADHLNKFGAVKLTSFIFDRIIKDERY